MVDVCLAFCLVSPDMGRNYGARSLYVLFGCLSAVWRWVFLVYVNFKRYVEISTVLQRPGFHRVLQQPAYFLRLMPPMS